MGCLVLRIISENSMNCLVFVIETPFCFVTSDEHKVLQG